jgi:hypothetical protein
MYIIDMEATHMTTEQRYSEARMAANDKRFNDAEEQRKADARAKKNAVIDALIAHHISSRRGE